MNQLPELPDFTPRTRPVPPGGLEQAVAVGRRRRNRFLGAASGTTTAFALVVAAVLSTPGGREDSLQQFADPQATSAAQPTPTPSPASGPDAEPTTDAQPATAPEPSPEPEDGEPENEQPEGGGAGAEPEPQAEQQPAPQDGGGQADTREPFVEEPREYALPMTCQGAPQQVGSSTSCIGASANREGSSANGRLPYCVAYNEASRTLHYDGGREHEVRVYRGEGGPLIYTFSQTVRYTQGPHSRRVDAGQCLEWNAQWDGTLADGSDAAPGEYWIMMTLEPDQVNDWPRSASQGGGIGFNFTLTED